MNGLLRLAVGLVRGLELDVTQDTFHVAVFSVIAWFKVRERYSLTGELSSWKRRDLRGRPGGG